MKRSVAKATGLMIAALFLLATVLPGLAEIKDNPYQVIVERNVFNVNPPPPPSNEPAPTPIPPPLKTSVKLTGISTLNAKNKALLEITPEPGKPALKPIMEVGDRVDVVELLGIDVAASTIKVRIGTSESTIGFTNTPSAAVPPPNLAAALAARPGMPVIPSPVPGAVPMPVPAPVPTSAAQPTYGNRGGVTVSGADINAGNPNFRTIPARPVRTDGTAAAATQTRAEAEIHMELLRTIQQQNAQPGRSAGPPLPPTTLTPLLQQ